MAQSGTLGQERPYPVRDGLSDKLRSAERDFFDMLHQAQERTRLPLMDSYRSLRAVERAVTAARARAPGAAR